MFSWQTPKSENKKESFISKFSSYLSMLQEYTNGIAEKRKLQEQKILEKEKARCDNFIQHISIISKAEKLSYSALINVLNELQPLKHPPERFRDSPHQGFPENEEGINVFYAIFKNNKLTENEIFTLLEILFWDLGYLEYREKLFDSPVIEILLNVQLKNILLDNYIYHLKFGMDSIPHELEPQIWYLLFTTHPPENLKEIIESLKDEFISFHKFLDFIKKWIEASGKSAEVMEMYDHLAKIKIKRSDENRHTKYYILKMAKQKVLSFEFDSKYAPPHSKEEKAEIKHFLDHSFSIFSCFHRTASRKIYEKMQINLQEARKDFQREEKRVEENFYKKYHL